MTNAPSRPLNEGGVEQLLDHEIEQVNGGVHPVVWTIWMEHMRRCAVASQKQFG